MSKTRVVLFQEGKIPQVFINPDIDKLSKLGKVLVNPKLPKKVPPHLWVLDKGKITVDRDQEPKPRVIVSRAPIKTPEQLDKDINKLDKDVDRYINSFNYLLDNIEKSYIDKYNKLCNITMLGYLLLFFVMINLHIEEIAKIIGV